MRGFFFKDETKEVARQQFISNIPDVLNSLLGVQSAQRGTQKIFDTLQNHMLNKQLFYVRDPSCFCIILFLCDFLLGYVRIASDASLSRTEATSVKLFLRKKTMKRRNFSMLFIYV
jgi:hypothetical protein